MKRLWTTYFGHKILAAINAPEEIYLSSLPSIEKLFKNRKLSIKRVYIRPEDMSEDMYKYIFDDIHNKGNCTVPDEWLD